MSTYLSAARIKLAVTRLGSCSAQTRLSDYLIFKRALVIVSSGAQTDLEAPQVETGTKSSHFVQAINEWAARVPDFGSLTEAENPYFVPVSAARDSTKGYRTRKFPSNGTSDTVARWQSQPHTPFKLISGTRPKAYNFVELGENELKVMFLASSIQQSSSGELPRISDLTTWWFRFIDLESRFGAKIAFPELVEAFKEDFGILPVEESLFLSDASEDVQWPENEDLSETGFSEEMAVSVEYLPPAAHEAALAPNFVHGGIENPGPTGKLPVEELHSYIRSRGFTFEPWQIATFVSAARTKPFVILAGISGTGKTRLPRLIAEATGATCLTVPVRPDWHDSSELLGYVGLNGDFNPGHLLRFARRAMESPEEQFFLVLDEMNIARVEYYLAEVLSRIEERSPNEAGSLQSEPFFSHLEGTDAAEWSKIALPQNLCIVGSVNMDETTFGFSKKVLDRGFVIEFSTVDLSLVDEVVTAMAPFEAWGSEVWAQPALTLAEHPRKNDVEVRRVIDALITVNQSLSNAQLQVGYRVRDEVAMFCLEAQRCPEQFATSTAGNVDPLDIAIAMKVLPRIQGSGHVIRTLLDSLLEWATAKDGSNLDPETGLPASFPFCEERIQLMKRRLQDTGFASYWI